MPLCDTTSLSATDTRGALENASSFFYCPVSLQIKSNNSILACFLLQAGALCLQSLRPGKSRPESTQFNATTYFPFLFEWNNNDKNIQTNKQMKERKQNNKKEEGLERRFSFHSKMVLNFCFHDNQIWSSKEPTDFSNTLKYDTQPFFCSLHFNLTLRRFYQESLLNLLKRF